jgi:hypothetical protein
VIFDPVHYKERRSGVLLVNTQVHSRWSPLS